MPGFATAVTGTPETSTPTGIETTRFVLRSEARGVPSESGSPRTSPASSIRIARPSLKFSKSPLFWMRSCSASDGLSASFALASAPPVADGMAA